MFVYFHIYLKTSVFVCQGEYQMMHSTAENRPGKSKTSRLQSEKKNEKKTPYSDKKGPLSFSCLAVKTSSSVFSPHLTAKNRFPPQNSSFGETCAALYIVCAQNEILLKICAGIHFFTSIS